MEFYNMIYEKKNQLSQGDDFAFDRYTTLLKVSVPGREVPRDA